MVRGVVVFRFADPPATLLVLAERIVRDAERARAERGEFRIALSGGSTPAPLYRLLADPSWAPRIDWTVVRVLFADERAVPPDHRDSNYRLVRESLLDRVGIPASSVERMRGDDPDLDQAARAYEACLEQPLDLLLLGIGEDGHIASIFPGSAAVTERSRRVLAVADSPRPPPRRLTVTPRTIDEARGVAVLVTGSSKAAAVAAALDGKGDASPCPARLVRGRDWYLDAEAAQGLGAGA